MCDASTAEVNTVVKRYKELEPSEIEKLYRFCHGFQPKGFYENREPMKAYLSSPLLHGGAHHVSCWHQGEVVATVGWIDRELAHKNELYLTHGFSSLEGLTHWPLLLQHIAAEVPLTKTLVKLGIRGNGNALELWAKEQQWLPLYNMLKMVKVLEGESVKNELVLKDLTHDTWKTFVEVHNAGFKTVPNGGLLEISERDETMAEYENGRLLMGYKDDEAIAMIMLKMHPEQQHAYLEAVAVDPSYHGKGYGQKTLQAVYNLLKTEYPAVKQLELMVMDANVNAHKLYVKEGFELDRIEVKWYMKDPVSFEVPL